MLLQAVLLLFATVLSPAVRADVSPGQASATPSVSDNVHELRQLLLDRPSVPITLPEGYAPPEPKMDLPDEGSSVVKLRCCVVYNTESGWYELTTPDDPNGPNVLPYRILWSQQLEPLEKYLKEDRSPVFRVTGEVTVYEDRAYLLLRNVVLEHSESASPAVTVLPPSEEESAAVTTQPQAAVPEAGSPEDILQRMLQDRPGKPLAVPSDPGFIESAGSVAPVGNRLPLQEDRGAMRIDRLVTLRRDPDSPWWLATFRSDNTLQDQPVRLLPCRKLRQTERLIESEKRKAVLLRVTGELTQYKGHRYLLLRIVLREPDLGQF